MKWNHHPQVSLLHLFPVAQILSCHMLGRKLGWCESKHGMSMSFMYGFLRSDKYRAYYVTGQGGSLLGFRGGIKTTPKHSN